MSDSVNQTSVAITKLMVTMLKKLYFMR